MTNELRDVLGTAEATTERGLPAFDHVVMAKGVTQRTKRRRAIKQTGTGLLAAVSIGVLGFGGLVAYDHFREVSPVVIPSVTEGPPPSPTPGGDWPDVADRAVTTGDGLPDAVALTGEAYATADTGWVLAVFDSTFRDGVNDPIWGEKVLYLISPSGDRYEVANLTRFGNPVLSAWDTERQVAFLVDNRYVAFTVDLASGEVTNEWQFCGEGGSMRAEDVPGEQWLLRGMCEGRALDGFYSDDGTLVTDDGVPDVEGGTVMAVGDVQVRYEFEMPPEDSYVAYHSDGSVVALQPVAEDIACYPQGPSLAGGLAVTCYGSSEMIATGWDLAADRGVIWNLDVNGGEPSKIAGLDTYLAIEDNVGETLFYEGISLNTYCLAGDLEVVGHGGILMAVLDEDGPIIMSNGEYSATICYGGAGQSVLVAGVGPLWTWDASTGATVTLLPVPEPSDDGTWVGASENGAIIHP